MSSSPAQKAQFAAAGFDRYTELLLACSPYLHVTAVGRLWSSSKELHGACQAVTQAQFPRLLQQLLRKLRHGDRDNASRVAELSWLCRMAGRAAVAAASQQCLDLGCYGNGGLTEEDMQVLVAHGARVTCQMVVDAARRHVDGAEVWLLAGVVDDAPDLLLWTSKGDVERLRDLLYNTDQLPPQQQLLDALQLAGNMMGCRASPWSIKLQGHGLLKAMLFPPIILSSGASPDARKQQLLALVPAADLEGLLFAAMRADDTDDGSVIVATALCSCPVAGELSGAAVLRLLHAATAAQGSLDVVSALGRLPGAADMPLDQVASLLPTGDADDWQGGSDVLRALLDMPRVQQAIDADVADELLSFAVESDLIAEASDMFEVVRGSVAAGLITPGGLAAAMEQCWIYGSYYGTGEDAWEEMWQELWLFPAAEGMSAEQLQGVLRAAITRGCDESAMEQLLVEQPFVQQRVDWHGLLKGLVRELRATSSGGTKQTLRAQLVLLVPWQVEKHTISRSQATELLQALLS